MNIEFGVKIKGNCSSFGGPDDTGVSESEGLALFERVDQMPNIFLTEQPEGTTGLARRLDPEKMYIAMRWKYATTPKEVLRRSLVLVSNTISRKSVLAVQKHVYAIPCDWGPNERTSRVCDLSPGLMKYLELETDDIVECTLVDSAGVKVVV